MTEIQKEFQMEQYLIHNIVQVIEQARNQVRQTVNSAMVQSYWEIGRLIVENEQQGEVRAEYGKQVLKHISATLTLKFGKGFDIRNLRRMRQFYQQFPIRVSVKPELSWTHYRRLLTIENQKAREWYLNKETVRRVRVNAPLL